MDETPAPTGNEMIDDGPHSCGIVEMDCRPFPPAGVDQNGWKTLGERPGKFGFIKMGSHDDQRVDPATHGAQGIARLFASSMKVREQQEIAAAARLPVHPANNLGKEFTVKVRKDHSNRIGTCKAEAAGSGVRHITKLTDGLVDALSRLLADVVEAIQGP
jgi:hypothetical protein